jgi:signal peptidase II
MYLIYAVVLFFALKYFFKNYFTFSRAVLFSWLLIFAGALSNLGERIYLGYVRDFIYVWSGVLNFADFYIILGVLILLLIYRQSSAA